MKFSLLVTVLFVQVTVQTSLVWWRDIVQRFNQKNARVSSFWAKALADSKVKQEIWKFCDEPSSDTYLLKADRVEIVPEIPTIGQDLEVRLGGQVLHRTTGGTVHCELKAGFLKVNYDFDLCSTMGSTSGEKCPLEVGPHNVTIKANIPKEIPAMTISGKVTAYDQDKNVLTCIQLDFKLAKP